MRGNYFRAPAAAVVCAAAVLAGAGGSAQTPAGAQGQPAARGSAPRGGVAPRLFAAIDADKDGTITRAEMKASFDKWFTEWDAGKSGVLAQDQLAAGLNAALPPGPGEGYFASAGGRPQNQIPLPEHVEAMVAALPAKAPAAPKQPRRVLVLARAAGFVHSSIPIAARTIEEMGKKTGAWSTTTTYDAADITEANLKQYDAIFLASTTGQFLDDPNDPAATAARRKALLDFVRAGKGLAAIHASSDSYHRSAPREEPKPAPAAAPAPAGAPAATVPPAAAPGPAAAPPAGRGGGGGRGGAAAPMAAVMLSQGDKNSDQKLSRDELGALADAWYEKVDTARSGRVARADFPERFAVVFPPPPPSTSPVGPTGFPIQGPAGQAQLGPDREVGTWPEFNKMIGGFFKFHWNDGQEITYKIDEPNHPLNAPFKKLKEPFVVIDETYTFGRETYSRQNLRVLTSVDYAKMSAEDKAKEQYPRPDGDYALSWIKRDGKGRVFYMAHGHNERVYAITLLLEHLLYGMQYVVGDLAADDSPSQKGGTK